MSDRRGDEEDERVPPPLPAAPEPAPPEERAPEPETPRAAPEESPESPEAPARPAQPVQMVPPKNWPPAGAPARPARPMHRPAPPAPEPVDRVPRRITPPSPPRARPAAPPVVRPPRPAPPPPRAPAIARPPAPPPLPAQPPEPVAQPRPRRSLSVRLLLLAAKGAAAFVIVSLLWVLAYRFINPPITLTMIGDRIAGRSITREWTPLARIDPVMWRAVIAGEDALFCSHHGFDFDALEKAYARNKKGGRIRGGSTVSQQTAKNVFLWQGGGYFRKGLEAWFTLLIEGIWGKRRIMEVYLNVAETGIGTYGVTAGARRYFHHDASRMTAREAAQLAAVLPLPKKRAGINPSGYTYRYGKNIAARIATVSRDRLDACVR